MRGEIARHCELGDRVISQTRRRVLPGEQVATADKLYSIFETHTDLIKRGKVLTPVEFGHKVFLAESGRGLITQYRVLSGNPADQGHVKRSLDRHKAIFKSAPYLYSSDRGFFNEENLQTCRTAGSPASRSREASEAPNGKRSKKAGRSSKDSASAPASKVASLYCFVGAG